MKTKSIFLTAIICILTLSLLTGCSPAEKEFSKDGFSITLTTNFEERDPGGSFLRYTSSKDYINVFVEKSDNLVALEEGGVTNEKDYAQMWLMMVNRDEEIVEADGLTYYRYTKDEGEHLHVAIRGTSAYYLVQFSLHYGDFEKWIDQFKTWAKSVQG